MTRAIRERWVDPINTVTTRSNTRNHNHHQQQQQTQQTRLLSAPHFVPLFPAVLLLMAPGNNNERHSKNIDILKILK